MRGATLKAILGLFLCLAMLPAARGESEFRFQMPSGWENLIDPEVSDPTVPADIMQQAKSGPFLIYAVDRERVARDPITATMSAVRISKTARVTDGVLKAVVAATSRRFVNVTYDPSETKVIKLGDVAIGQIAATLKTAKGEERTIGYFIPGRTQSVILTYGCSAELFDHYRPIFEASAMATTGAYSVPWFAAIDWSPLLLYASLGLAALAFAAVKTTSRKQNVATATLLPSLPLTWECATCKRHVPMRLSECRCGRHRDET